MNIDKSFIKLYPISPFNVIRVCLTPHTILGYVSYCLAFIPYIHLQHKLTKHKFIGSLLTTVFSTDYKGSN